MNSTTPSYVFVIYIKMCNNKLDKKYMGFKASNP